MDMFGMPFPISASAKGKVSMMGQGNALPAPNQLLGT